MQICTILDFGRGSKVKVFIVYCHPSEDSFTRNVRDSFIKGIVDSGNEYILSDLYKMDFKTDMSEKEYLRDANYNEVPAHAIPFRKLKAEDCGFTKAGSGLPAKKVLQ